MNIIISGALGHMGQILRSKIEDQGDMKIAYLVDKGADTNPGNVPVYGSFSEVPKTSETGKVEADIIIDFSNAAATEDLLDFAKSSSIPLLIATTGQSEEQRTLIEEASHSIPIFYSGNMSLGIALLTTLVRQAVSSFPTADIEIVETHHNRKADAPSGTALMLAEAARSARPELTVNVGRSGMCKREKSEIGISSVRRGNIVGIHEVIISTDTQSITLMHEAHDRGLFADGAIDAARFLVKQGPGLYDMNHLVAEKHK